MRLTLGKVGWGVVGTLLLITPLWVSRHEIRDLLDDLVHRKPHAR